MELTGKTALVTGASRGIGRAIATRLAADGALVAVHYGHDDAAARETMAAIERVGGAAFAVRAEFGVDGDVDTLFAGVEQGLTGRPLDILVNNAAAFAGTLDQVTPEEFDRLFAINVKTPYFAIKRALPLLRDGGRIVNVSSAATRIAMPETAYAMTKGAVDVLGRNLAQRLGPRRITVNTVAPGVTETDMNSWIQDAPHLVEQSTAITALGRVGQPEDIADAIAFLVSEDARWITGQWLDVTGGLLLGPGEFRNY
ncbi:short-chain dehydrogenase [Amycolatopsis sp. WAC 04197]|uniref:SDR family NAD(P)-dependent oxidoreductase n=1 Tax=Amycolatopsis sp. WAC 04197 TaxID=2203199 RepID=UPI000F7986BC|nr:SDR family oxidoreductase [Amycolatopsis sp. WAC 04197]RSN43439.1 short-chain dehydrogenase [Amycolatopsis sp. WAC 04197]